MAATTMRNPATVRTVIAAIIGNLLEFFDFMSYGFFAVQIGHAFFPVHDRFAQVMLALLTFGIGFVTRPLGAVVFGWYADRAGHARALYWTFALMAFGTALLGLTPSYASWGMAAPCLVVLGRLIQGFATGGEAGPASVFLFEQERAGRRSFLPSFQFGTQAIAMSMATGLGVAITASLPPAQLASWGWRIPFVLGILIAPVGLYLRRQIREPDHAPQSARPPLRKALATAPRATLAVFLINGGETIRVYVQGYMVTFGVMTLHLAPWQAMLATMLGAVATAIVSIGTGYVLADHHRLRLVVCSQIGSLVFAYPAFLLVCHHPSLLTLCVLTVGFGLVTGPRSGAGLSLMIESLPQAVRAVTFGTVYAAAATILGSTTQPMIAWMTHSTGNPVAPAWYLTGALAVSTATYIWLLPVSRRAAAAPAPRLTTRIPQAEPGA